MKDTSKVALDSIQSMLDFIRSNERQSQDKYMVIFLAFDSVIVDKRRFNTREEAKAYAMRTRCLTSIVCQEGDYHVEEKQKLQL